MLTLYTLPTLLRPRRSDFRFSCEGPRCPRALPLLSVTRRSSPTHAFLHWPWARARGGGAQARVRGGVGLLAGDSVLQIPYFWFARGRQPGRSPSAPLLPRLPPPRRAPGSGVGVSRGCGHLRCAASAPAAARPNNPRLTLYPKRRKTVRASFGGRSPASCKLCLRSS